MHMTKRKPTGNEEKEQGGKPNRNGRSINFYLDDEVDAAMKEFFDSVEFPPNQTEFFDRAAKDYLAKKGFWPPRAK